VTFEVGKREPQKNAQDINNLKQHAGRKHRAQIWKLRHVSSPPFC
jgi:hypothetical protein